MQNSEEKLEYTGTGHISSKRAAQGGCRFCTFAVFNVKHTLTGFMWMLISTTAVVGGPEGGWCTQGSASRYISVILNAIYRRVQKFDTTDLLLLLLYLSSIEAQDVFWTWFFSSCFVHVSISAAVIKTECLNTKGILYTNTNTVY